MKLVCIELCCGGFVKFFKKMTAVITKTLTEGFQ